MLTRGLNPFIEVKKINPDGAAETMNVEESGWAPSLMNSRFQITQMAFGKHGDVQDTLKKRGTPASSTKGTKGLDIAQIYDTQRQSSCFTDQVTGLET